MLQEIFNSLCRTYTNDQTLIDTLWKEIAHHYGEKGRYYHTLTHLEKLYRELLPLKEVVNEWDVVLFTLFYHDIIYKPTQGDNEEQSALVAEQRMLQLGISTESAKKCVDQIMATKTHTLSKDKDTDLFTDADLSILGQAAEVYDKYAADVRKEYKIYPELLYKPGRKKVLRHFLDMERIFKTEEFYGKYEDIARFNLERELGML